MLLADDDPVMVLADDDAKVFADDNPGMVLAGDPLVLVNDDNNDNDPEVSADPEVWADKKGATENMSRLEVSAGDNSIKELSSRGVSKRDVSDEVASW